jgi:hypothetical protein
MLYPINPPSCSPALGWAVQLQCDLITALCDPNTTPTMVTPQWVRVLRPNPPEIADWLERFAGRTFEKVKLIDAMEHIASLNGPDKILILDHFNNNHQFTNAFIPGFNAPAITDISTIINIETQSALKTILKAFYGNGLAHKNGFPVNSNGNPGRCTDRKIFVDTFVRDNKINVCPLCDGDLNGPEVDHWLPESKYPALSCHPKNLVPICHDCNSPGNKHHKAPLSAGHKQPFEEWFHPYERPAAGQFSVEISDGKSVRLANANTLQQARLDNLDSLINLSNRWSNVYQQQKEDYLRMLAGKVRRGNIAVNAVSLLRTIQNWIDEVVDTRFDKRHSLIKLHILNSVNNTNSPDFTAWLQRMDDAL